MPHMSCATSLLSRVISGIYIAELVIAAVLKSLAEAIMNSLHQFLSVVTVT